MEKNKRNNDELDGEKRGTSRYGEFIPSYFYWLTQEHQREKAERLAHITDEKGREKKQNIEKERK